MGRLGIKKIALLSIFSTVLILGKASYLFAQDVQEGDTLDPQALSGAVSFVSDTYNSATNYISSFFSVAEPVQPAIETESVSTGLIVPAASLAAMGIAADAAQVDNYPVPQTPPQGDLGADALFTLPIPEYRISEVPIQLPDRLPEPEGYRPPMPAVRQPEPITQVDRLPASEIQTQVDQTPSNQIASAYPDAGASAQQIQVTPLAGNPSCDTTAQAQPAFVPRQPSTNTGPNWEVAYGPGFNTMKSSSELYYFNRMIQKLPPEQRAQVASHADYINQNGENLPISTRRHLGIPVDYSTITRESHNKLFIDKELAQDVTRRFYEPANQEYRDNIDRMNNASGYNDPG